MKKVFSVKKFEKYMLSRHTPKKKIESSKKIWANKCDGKTEEEMLEMDLLTSDNWMIVIED